MTNPLTNRFDRDYALVRPNGTIVAESHSRERLEALRLDCLREGIVLMMIRSDLPRRPWRD